MLILCCFEKKFENPIKNCQDILQKVRRMGSTDRKIRDKIRSHKRIYFDYISIVAPSTSNSKHKQVEKLIFFLYTASNMKH